MADNPNEPTPLFAESLPDQAFGTYDADGSIRSDVAVSAVSGRPASAGDPYIRIEGSNLFYRVTAEEWRSITRSDDTNLQSVGEETRQRIEWAAGSRSAVSSDTAMNDESNFRSTYNIDPIQQEGEGE